MKESKVEEFLRKVDRPWGMSKAELEIFQKEVEKLEHDLEVYKIAFRNVLYDADKKINTVYKNYGYCSVKMKNSQYYLEQAEKKLKGGCNDD